MPTGQGEPSLIIKDCSKQLNFIKGLKKSKVLFWKVHWVKYTQLQFEKCSPCEPCTRGILGKNYAGPHIFWCSLGTVSMQTVRSLITCITWLSSFPFPSSFLRNLNVTLLLPKEKWQCACRIDQAEVGPTFFPSKLLMAVQRKGSCRMRRETFSIWMRKGYSPASSKYGMHILGQHCIICIK